jgi:hypothetical protein
METENDFYATNCIGYGRLSTPQQLSDNNMGLAIQASKTDGALERHGLGVSKWYDEVANSLETSLDERLSLWAAVEEALLQGLPLAVSDLSRIGRDPKLIEGIYGLGIEIFAADLERMLSVETAIKLTKKNLDIYERKAAGSRRSSERRKAAGQPVGNPNIRAHAPNGMRANAERAQAFGKGLLPHVEAILQSMQAEGYKKENWSEVARRLNATGFRTRRRKDWTGKTIARVYEQWA